MSKRRSVSGKDVTKDKALKCTAAELKEQYDEVAIELAMSTFAPEDLRAEYKAAYERVRDHGLSVCSKCRWHSGCMRCDERKAWRYYVRLELGMGLPSEGMSKKQPAVKGGGCEAHRLDEKL
jgi:hypothetical protein